MANSKPPRPRRKVIKLDEELLEGSTVCRNLSQEILVITTDKAKLCLLECQFILASQRNWIAPLGIFLTLLLSFAATDFKDFLGFSADFWQAFFFVALIMSGSWLMITLWKAFRNRGKGSVDSLINKLKESSPGTESVRISPG